MTVDRGTAEGQWQTWLERLPWDGWISDSDALQIWGYVSQPSYRPGDTVDLCVSTTALVGATIMYEILCLLSERKATS
jgi:hypothetical protein